MSLSNNINTFADVEGVLRTAVANGGGRYTLPTRGKAVNWRMRAYQFRKLYLEQELKKNKLPGHTPSTWLDNVIFKLATGSSVVVITVREVEGTLETFGEEPLNKEVLEKVEEASQFDPLLLAALEIAKDKGA